MRGQNSIHLVSPLLAAAHFSSGKCRRPTGVSVSALAAVAIHERQVWLGATASHVKGRRTRQPLNTESPSGSAPLSDHTPCQAAAAEP